MEYKNLCKNILESDPSVTYAFLVSSTARLVSFSSEDSVEAVDEEQFAELMEDMIFVLASRKRYEQPFGMVQFVYMEHKKINTLLLPFEDMVLCICAKRTNEFDKEQFIRKMQDIVEQSYTYVTKQV